MEAGNDKLKECHFPSKTIHHGSYFT